METKISDFTEHLDYWLRYVSSHATRAFRTALQCHGVSAAEWVFMRELYNYETISPVNLASVLGMTRGSITKLTDRLQAKGLVIRENDLDDGRARVLMLSAPGRALVPELSTIADDNDKNFFSHLTADERQIMIEMLKNLVARKKLRTVLITV